MFTHTFGTVFNYHINPSAWINRILSVTSLLNTSYLWTIILYLKCKYCELLFCHLQSRIWKSFDITNEQIPANLLRTTKFLTKSPRVTTESFRLIGRLAELIAALSRRAVNGHNWNQFRSFAHFSLHDLISCCAVCSCRLWMIIFH